MPGASVVPLMAVTKVTSAAVAPYGGAGASAPVVSVRKEFPETWLWQTIAPTRYLGYLHVSRSMN